MSFIVERATDLASRLSTTRSIRIAFATRAATPVRRSLNHSDADVGIFKPFDRPADAEGDVLGRKLHPQYLAPVAAPG
jgi:hypothetical protein